MPCLTSSFLARRRNVRRSDVDSFRLALLAGASLFAFENHSHIWNAHWLFVDPGIHVAKDFRSKLAVLILGPNVLPSIMRHHVLGE